MGYRLWVNDDWCGGKVYGYEGVEYLGAIWLYQNNEHFRYWVDDYDFIEDIGERVRAFFEGYPCFEVELTGEEFLMFLKLYRGDAKHDFKYFEPINLNKKYILEWW